MNIKHVYTLTHFLNEQLRDADIQFKSNHVKLNLTNIYRYRDRVKFFKKYR